MPNGNESFTKVANLPLRQVGSHTCPDLQIDVAVEGFLCTVDGVPYARSVHAAWASWAISFGRPPPLFNWVAVLNFRLHMPDCIAFSIRVEDRTEALMLVQERHVVRCDSGHRGPLVYVSFIEVAPWNHPGARRREIRGLGPYLLRAASDLSLQRGFEGRVGLHSVPAAESFYRSLGFTSCDCPSEYHELYMELDDTGAQRLLLSP